MIGAFDVTWEARQKLALKEGDGFDCAFKVVVELVQFPAGIQYS
jgi:hypothetical protein